MITHDGIAMIHSIQWCHLSRRSLNLGSITSGRGTVGTWEGTTDGSTRGGKSTGEPMTDKILDGGGIDSGDEVGDGDGVAGTDRAEQLQLIGGGERGTGGFFGKGSECAGGIGVGFKRRRRREKRKRKSR